MSTPRWRPSWSRASASPKVTMPCWCTCPRRRAATVAHVRPRGIPAPFAQRAHPSPRSAGAPGTGVEGASEDDRRVTMAVLTRRGLAGARSSGAGARRRRPAALHRQPEPRAGPPARGGVRRGAGTAARGADRVAAWNVCPDFYTHGHHESVLRSHRWRTVENSAGYLLAATSYRVARCSTSAAGPAPSPSTSRDGSAREPWSAIDPSVEVLAAARADAQAAGVTNVDYREGDVNALDVRRRVVRRRPRPSGAAAPHRSRRPRLVEMRRVCRHDGVVGARDSDYAAFTWFPEDPDLTRWLELYHEVARSNHAEPDAGRRLLSWARHAGFARRAAVGIGLVLTPAPRSGTGGADSGPIASSSRLSPSRRSNAGSSTADELARHRRAWRRWAARRRRMVRDPPRRRSSAARLMDLLGVSARVSGGPSSGRRW